MSSRSQLKRIAAQRRITLDFVKTFTNRNTRREQHMFMHHWPTGHQMLLFDTLADAAAWLLAEQAADRRKQIEDASP